MKNKIFASIVSICAGLTVIAMIAAPNIDQRQVPTLAITTTKGDEAIIKNKHLDFEYQNEKKYGKNFPRTLSFYQGKSEFSQYVRYEEIGEDGPRNDIPLWSRPTETWYQVLPNGNTLYYEANNNFVDHIVTIRYSLYDGKKAIKKHQEVKYVVDSEEYYIIDISGQVNQDEIALVILDHSPEKQGSYHYNIKKVIISTTTGEASPLETVELPKEMTGKDISLREQPISEQAIPYIIYENSSQKEDDREFSYYLYDAFSNQFEALGQHEYINDSYGEKLSNADNIFVNGTHYEVLEVLPKDVSLEDAGLEEKNQSNDSPAENEEEIDRAASYPHQLIVAKWDKKEQVYQTVLEYPVEENTEWYKMPRTNHIVVKEAVQNGVQYMIYDIESESVIYEGTIQLAHPSEGDELHLLNYSMY